MAELATASPDQERAVLPRDVAVFLPLFAIALHKVTTYPPGHPLLGSAVEASAQHLNVVLVNRPFLLLGVARNQLLLEGFATDPDNPVLREFAAKLHRHQLGAIKFTPGVSREEVQQLFTALATDSRLHPLGTDLEKYDTMWDHIRLLPPAYDKLELTTDAEGQSLLGEQAHVDSSASRLWMGLAAAAIAREGAPELHTDPRAIARALNQKLHDPEQARKVVSYLLGLSKELRMAHGAEAVAIKEKLGTLLNHLTGDALKELATLGADLAQRRRLVVDAAMVLPAGATLTLLRAVSDANQQAIPQQMMRLLTKLAFQAEKGNQVVREEADLALREAVRQMVDRWTLDDPNPAPYTKMLERLARNPLGQPAKIEMHPTEAIRLIQMSLETDTVGDTVWTALEELVREGEASQVVALVDDGRVAEDIVEQIWIHLATASNMRILLNNEPRDTEVVERLLDRMGMAAAEPMLETLEVADSRAMRRRLLTRLGKLGPAIGSMLVERLPGSPWFVQRNLLALLGSLPELPAEFNPTTFVEADDPRVRREAIKLMLRTPVLRDEAILASLGDDDDANVRIGLAAALDGCPPAGAGRVWTLLNDRRLQVEVRVLAIRVLGTIRTRATRDWMVEHALTKQGWFRRRRLVPRSLELLAILGCLARSFRQDPNAQLVLQLAQESEDPLIQRAATGAVEEA